MYTIVNGESTGCVLMHRQQQSQQHQPSPTRRPAPASKPKRLPISRENPDAAPSLLLPSPQTARVGLADGVQVRLLESGVRRPVRQRRRHRPSGTTTPPPSGQVRAGLQLRQQGRRSSLHRDRSRWERRRRQTAAGEEQRRRQWGGQDIRTRRYHSSYSRSVVFRRSGFIQSITRLGDIAMEATQFCVRCGLLGFSIPSVTREHLTHGSHLLRLMGISPPIIAIIQVASRAFHQQHMLNIAYSWLRYLRYVLRQSICCQNRK